MMNPVKKFKNLHNDDKIAVVLGGTYIAAVTTAVAIVGTAAVYGTTKIVAAVQNESTTTSK